SAAGTATPGGGTRRTASGRLSPGPSARTAAVAKRKSSKIRRANMAIPPLGRSRKAGFGNGERENAKERKGKVKGATRRTRRHGGTRSLDGVNGINSVEGRMSHLLCSTSETLSFAPPCPSVSPCPTVKI